MRTACVMLLVIASAVSAAAQSPVAMRVEVEEAGPADGGRQMEVRLQVSPEDRGRIGDNAMVRIELDGEAPPGQSPLWAVRLGADGSAVIDTVWPPGEHDLRVTIESPGRRHTGLWVGRVRVPGAGVMAAEPKAVGPPAVEGPAAVGIGSPDPVATDLVADDAEEDAASAGSEVASGPEPPNVVPADSAVEGFEAPRAVPESGAAGEAVGAAAPPTQDERLADSVPASDPAPPKREAPFAEPLRSSPPTGPPAADRGEPERSGPVMPAPAVDAISAWQEAPTGTRELTVVATRDGEPAAEMSPQELRLIIGRSATPVTATGGRLEAPLLLGLAVDLSPRTAAQWDRIVAGLDPLLERAQDGLGRSFAAIHGAVGPWHDGVVGLDEAGNTPADGSLPALVAGALQRFDGQRGRAFLVVVTDGRGGAPRSAWSRAGAAVGDAGVPLLVVAIWDRDFDERTRRQLSRLAESSGGRSFLVHGLGQLDGAVERYGPVLDGGVAVRFPGEALSGVPQRVEVTSSDPRVEITAPASIR